MVAHFLGCAGGQSARRRRLSTYSHLGGTPPTCIPKKIQSRQANPVHTHTHHNDRQPRLSIISPSASHCQVLSSPPRLGAAGGGQPGPPLPPGVRQEPGHPQTQTGHLLRYGQHPPLPLSLSLSVAQIMFAQRCSLTTASWCRTHTRTHTHTHTHMHTHMHAHKDTHTPTHTHKDTHVQRLTHTQMDRYMDTHTRTRTHKHTHKLNLTFRF